VTLIIADASLETIPESIMGHKSVLKHAQRLGKKPSELLLDRSYHHSAMKSKKLVDIWKRGRPDIVHFALAEALSTPLYLKSKLDVYIHTTNSELILTGPNLRIPKSYFRFEGLMMKLFKDRSIRSEFDNKLLFEILDDVPFRYLLKNIIRSHNSIGFSSRGVMSTVQEVVSKYVNPSIESRCAIIIGGFPKGRFSDGVQKYLDILYSIGQLSLEAHVVVARVLYECEKLLLMEY
jgi:rRNA small subunit pseudouridine methyltransferase Nep1